MQLLISENQMREDIRKSLAVLSVLSRKTHQLNFSLRVAGFLLPLGAIAFLLDLWSLPSAGLFNVATAVSLTVLIHARSTTRSSYRRVAEYLDYLLSDRRARDFYSQLSEDDKAKSGYRPRPGTRLGSPSQ